MPRRSDLPPSGPAAGEAEREVRVHGRRACRALFERRPEAVARVYLVEERVAEFGPFLRRFARDRLPYRIVPPDEVHAVSGSAHHEGVCAVARPRPAAVLEEVLGQPGPGWAVALPDVRNPHNVGAILRTAAHFGARAALLAGGGALPSAAYRTAEGGAEWLDLVFPASLEGALAACRAAGFGVLATSSRDGRNVFEAPLPGRAVVLLGAEDRGLPEELLRQADLRLRIPGTGRVESLNVASAAAVLLGELWRRHGAKLVDGGRAPGLPGG